MKRNLSKLLAYIYMPVIFLIVGVGAIILLLYPFWSVGSAAANLLFSQTAVKANPLEWETFSTPEIIATPKPDNTIDIAGVKWPKNGEEYGKLSCETIGLDTNVSWGDSYEILRKGPGTYKGGGIPGNGRTILVAGHNTMEFTVLQNIKNGDVIKFETSYGIYEYEVTDSKILEATDPSAFDLRQKKEELVLYTCYPFTELSATTSRFFVYGKRISGPDLVRVEEGS